MQIQAKFRCESVKSTAYQTEVVEMSPAHGPGNEAWSKATPGGKVELSISNPGAQGQFKPGKHYLLTFAEAE